MSDPHGSKTTFDIRPTPFLDADRLRQNAEAIAEHIRTDERLERANRLGRLVRDRFPEMDDVADPLEAAMVLLLRLADQPPQRTRKIVARIIEPPRVPIDGGSVRLYEFPTEDGPRFVAVARGRDLELLASSLQSIRPSPFPKGTRLLMVPPGAEVEFAELVP